MPPMPPMPPAPPAGGPSFSGASTTQHSDVVNNDATLIPTHPTNESNQSKSASSPASTSQPRERKSKTHPLASTNAVLTTFNGSRIPFLIISTYSP